MRRLIIFGAGASYGSQGILPVSHPLGVNLFKVLQKSFPDTWGAIGPHYTSRFEEHFESGMEAIWSVYPAALSSLVPGVPSPHALMQDMARFFLCFTLGPRQQDTYSHLLLTLDAADKLRNTQFATLNYEHLLEQAMGQCGMRPAVIRPHGGCQLWPKRGGKLSGMGERAIGQGYHQISTHILPHSRKQLADRLCHPDEAGYPCMAIYVRSKVTQVAQAYLRRIQWRLRQAVVNSDKIAVVGVRPWPTDKHIWGPLGESMATLYYIGSRQHFDELCTIRDNLSTHFVDERFDTGTKDLVSVL